MPVDNQPEWTEFPVPWLFECGVVRVLQKRGAVSRDELWRRVCCNEMTQPYIVETLTERRLHFTRDATQTSMLLNDPEALVAPYMRKMMSFLLFSPHPARILMIGLGGGALPKFCYRQLEHTDITVVEVDQSVIALRNEFRIPNDDERFRVLHADGARYIETVDHYIDVILIDAFDAHGIAESLAQSDFYARAAARLTKNGVLVMNLWGASTRYVDNLKQLREAFDKSILLVPVTNGANLVLFAFKRLVPTSIDAELESHAQWLQSHLKLDFPRYLRRILQGHSLSAQ
jgi:spermidine synthase